MIKVIERHGRWLIAKNPRWISTGGITGALGDQGKERQTFDECWTEDGWISSADLGMVFPSKEEADEYLILNRDRMAATI